MIKKEKAAIKNVGGKIKFSDEITFSSSAILINLVKDNLSTTIFNQ